MTEFELQQLEQQRQRFGQMAQAQAPQGQMVGNTFVAPNALQYLAAGLRGVGGMRGEAQATEQIRQGKAGQQRAIADALRGFSEKASGAPAQPEMTGNNPSAYTPAQAAQAPDLGGAYQALLQAPDATLRQAGMQGMLSQATPKPRKMERVELPTPDGGRRVGFVDMNAPNPLQTFVEAGTENAALSVGPAGQAYNPRALQPGQVLADPNKPFTIVDGKPVANSAFQQYETNKAAQSAPRVNVDARNFNTQESEQSKKYGAGLGEIRSEINRAGFEAPGKLAQLDRMEQLLAGSGGGAIAPTAAQIASVAASAGIKIDPNLGPKEAAEALAREMAANMRQPGTGPMTDKDFDNFLKRVPDLSKTPAGRAEITKTMRAAIMRDMQAAKFAREYARNNGGVIDDSFFDAMADFYVKNPIVTPPLPDTNARGELLNRADAIVGGGRK